MKKQLNEFRRMQKLAGLITESQLNEESNFDTWRWNDNHGMDIVFKSSPANPSSMLTQHDPEYLDGSPESETFTKEDYWKNDIMKFQKIPQGFYDEGGVIKADKLSDGTWNFRWDSGEISGFVEGEDFDFIPEEEL